MTTITEPAAHAAPAPRRAFWRRGRLGQGLTHVQALAQIERLELQLSSEGAVSDRLSRDLDLARHRIDAPQRGHADDVACIDRLRGLLADRYADLHHTAAVLGDQAHALLQERHAHAETRKKLATAIRANRSNAEAKTVQTDVSVLRAAPADAFVDEPAPGPEYAPYERVQGPVVQVMPLGVSPLAAHPARVPDLAEMAAAE